MEALSCVLYTSAEETIVGKQLLLPHNVAYMYVWVHSAAICVYVVQQCYFCKSAIFIKQLKSERVLYELLLHDDMLFWPKNSFHHRQLSQYNIGAAPLFSQVFIYHEASFSVSLALWYVFALPKYVE